LESSTPRFSSQASLNLTEGAERQLQNKQANLEIRCLSQEDPNGT